MHTLYLTIHDKHHEFAIEGILGNKFILNRITVLKVHLNKLPVHISSIKYTVVDAKKIRLEIKVNDISSVKNEPIVVFRVK